MYNTWHDLGECDLPDLDALGGWARLTCPGVHAAEVFTAPQDLCAGASHEESGVRAHQGIQGDHSGTVLYRHMFLGHSINDTSG